MLAGVKNSDTDVPVSIKVNRLAYCNTATELVNRKHWHEISSWTV